MNFIKRIIQKEFPFIFAAPAIVWQIVFLYIPLCFILISSFIDYSATYEFLRWSFINYSRVLKPVYIKVILNSFTLAFLVTIISLIISYPVAYFLAFNISRMKIVWLFLLVLPSWTNLIVQVYSWFFLLEKKGLFSQVLYQIGVISQLQNMINNYFAVLLGMVYCFLPFMILPIYTVLEKIDRRLFEASEDLGASRFKTIIRIVFPLSLPGILTGCFLVFIPAYSEFVIPTLLGGAKKAYWGTVIVDKFLVERDWESGFALATLGVIFLLISYLIIYLFIKFIKYIHRNRIYKQKIRSNF